MMKAISQTAVSPGQFLGPDTGILQYSLSGLGGKDGGGWELQGQWAPRTNPAILTTHRLKRENDRSFPFLRWKKEERKKREGKEEGGSILTLFSYLILF